MSSRYEEGILRALRRITRAIDLYSRQLAGRFGLTGPQLVCLKALSVRGPCTPSELSREVDLSQATVTGIIDRLEGQKLVVRARNQADRRRVIVSLTSEGEALLARAPSPLHDQFLKALSELPEVEQQSIHDTLEKVVGMMGAQRLDAAPILATGPADVTAKQVQELLEPSEIDTVAPASPSSNQVTETRDG